MLQKTYLENYQVGAGWSRTKGRLAIGLEDYMVTPQLSYFSLRRRSNWGRGKKSQRVEHQSKSLNSSSSSPYLDLARQPKSSEAAQLQSIPGWKTAS